MRALFFLCLFTLVVAQVVFLDKQCELVQRLPDDSIEAISHSGKLDGLLPGGFCGDMWQVEDSHDWRVLRGELAAAATNEELKAK